MKLTQKQLPLRNGASASLRIDKDRTKVVLILRVPFSIREQTFYPPPASICEGAYVSGVEVRSIEKFRIENVREKAAGALVFTASVVVHDSTGGNRLEQDLSFWVPSPICPMFFTVKF